MLNFASIRNFAFPRKLKKFFLSVFVIFGFLTFAFYERLIAPPNTQDGRSGLVPPAIQSIASEPPTNYKDGSYIGSAITAGYGKVQVKAIIRNGRISGVEFLDYPHDRQTSQQINAQAIPSLQQEAIQTQSANVDAVSGATLTSKAFVDSLQSALQSAQN